MIEVNTLASLTVVIGFIGSVIAYMAKQWHNYKVLSDRVRTLEKSENKILGDYMTKGDHAEMQNNCKQAVYRDMRALEEKIESVDKRIEQGEAQRELARAEDLKWKAEMQEAVVEIRTIVKQELYYKRKEEFKTGIV